MRCHVMLVMVLMLALLASCSQSSLMKSVSSSADEKVATHYVDLLRDHQYAQIEKDIDPSLRKPNMHDELLAMAAVIPAQPPLSVKLVGAHVFKSPGVYKTNYAFEYQYPDRWLLISVATQTKDGVFTLIGFSTNKLKDSLEHANLFTLAGKSPLQYLVLAAAVLIPLFCIFALVLCARTPIPKRKWLWIIFILLGVGTLSVNWTTGQWGCMPISVMLLGASMTKPLFGAWTLSISVPLGAIWFLARRGTFLRESRITRSLPPELPNSDAR